MYSFEARLAAREALYVVTLDLVAEFAHLPAGTVIGLVGRAREDLLRAGVRDGLVDATESLARSWLDVRTMAHA